MLTFVDKAISLINGARTSLPFNWKCSRSNHFSCAPERSRSFRVWEQNFHGPSVKNFPWNVYILFRFLCVRFSWDCAVLGTHNFRGTDKVKVQESMWMSTVASLLRVSWFILSLRHSRVSQQDWNCFRNRVLKIPTAQHLNSILSFILEEIEKLQLRAEPHLFEASIRIVNLYKGF